MDKLNERLFDEEEVNQPVRCLMCGWEGFEAELEEDYCPQCGSGNLE